MKTVASKPENGIAENLLGVSHILVPVDFTDCSSRAITVGIELASQFHAELLLLHVVEDHITGPWPFDLARVIAGSHRPSPRGKLHDLSSAEIPPEIITHELIVCGAPAHEIVRVARANDIDLIVLGTHCRSGFEHALVGSVAELVIQRAPCPVLALPFHVTCKQTDQTNSR